MRLTIFTPLVALLLPQVRGQDLNSLISGALSIYSEVTSILASDAATPSTTSSSATSTSTSFSTITTSSSILPATTSSQPTSTSASSTANVAAATGTAVPGTTASHHTNTLAIVLGTVLGALALGLLALVLVLCCRRRRHKGSAPILPVDEEVDGWRVHGSRQHSITSRQISEHSLIRGGAGPAMAAAPLMSEHPAYRNHVENPFSDPPRRSAPNARPGLTDESRPADLPYYVEKESGRPVSLGRSSDSHGVRDAAFGAGLGAAAMHHHDNYNHQENPFNEKQPHIYSHIPSPEQRRRSESLGRASTKEAWPYGGEEGPVPNPPRISNESHRRSTSRDAARANAAFDNAYTPAGNFYERYNSPASFNQAAEIGGPATPSHRPEDPLMSGAVGAGAGALAGAVINHHAHQQPQNVPQRRHSRNVSGVHELPVTEDVPPAPFKPRSRHNSPLRNSIPVDGRENHQNRPRAESHPPRGTTLPPLQTHLPGRQRDQTPPNLPSRSPHRTSRFESPAPINPEPRRDSFASPVSPLRPGEGMDTMPLASPPITRGIVGDNGYPSIGPQASTNNNTNTNTNAPGFTHPHIGFAQRNAAGYHQPPPVENHNATIASPTAFVHTLHASNPSPSRPDQSSASNSYNTNSSSDDSTWRSSTGMPGGWARASPRNSLDNALMAGRKESPLAANSGRRLRLSDLRKEEEENMRGRKELNMEGPVVGPARHPGVGQAL